MEKKPDEYCEQIFIALWIINEKTRFNELHRKLTKKYHVKISKPTLVQHLNHLVQNKMIQQNVEGKQRVSYKINWKKFKQLQEALKTSDQTTINNINENKKRFKSKSLVQQEIYTTAMLTIGELYYLKLNILDILEPENKLQNHFSYTLIRQFYNMYAKWLYESCKQSKENSQKAIQSIDKSIKKLTETFLEYHQQKTQNAKHLLGDISLSLI